MQHRRHELLANAPNPPPEEWLTLTQASRWASAFLGKPIDPSNITYLVQYGKIKKHSHRQETRVHAEDLKTYYSALKSQKESAWKARLGDDLNWHLSFDDLREKDTTKHVHRLHPYKGKFIPQLVAYFLDSQTDDLKRDVFFGRGDIVLDPFSGSGTTLVAANELGMHTLGVDISRFNGMITEAKLDDYDLGGLADETRAIHQAIIAFERSQNIHLFEKALNTALSAFNQQHFPSPHFKRAVYTQKIDETEYALEKEAHFLGIYQGLVKQYGIVLEQAQPSAFLDTWYLSNVRQALDVALCALQACKTARNKKLLSVILSRTMRSCRATTHFDLATLKKPQRTSYYCFKHKKICKPLFSIQAWFKRYANDTIARVGEFSALKTPAHWAVITADAQTVDLLAVLQKSNPRYYELIKTQKIKGIFSSPPYVGQIDYHQQHAYAYDLFGFERLDNREIGPLFKGQGRQARAAYVEGVARVLRNAKKWMRPDFDVFLVTNDKWNLYPQIAQKAGMRIVKCFKRPVLNRTERDRNPYAESIFQLKEA